VSAALGRRAGDDPPSEALEQAGGAIEEFHTDAPDWETLIQEHLGEMERPR
jgi:hypothetical protein